MDISVRINKLIEKCDDSLNDSNDQHDLLGSMLYSITSQRILRLMDNKNILISYFSYSPDVLEKIEKYEIKKLMVFLQKVIKQWKGQS